MMTDHLTDEEHEAMGCMLHRGKVEEATRGRNYHREIAEERDLLREDLEHMEGLAEKYLADANALTSERNALRAEVERLTRERDQWEDAAGKSFVRAEQAEDLAATAERKLAMAIQILRSPDLYGHVDLSPQVRVALAELEKADD